MAWQPPRPLQQQQQQQQGMATQQAAHLMQCIRQGSSSINSSSSRRVLLWVFIRSTLPRQLCHLRLVVLAQQGTSSSLQ
jgi:hypothetical protein